MQVQMVHLSMLKSHKHSKHDLGPFLSFVFHNEWLESLLALS